MPHRRRGPAKANLDAGKHGDKAQLTRIGLHPKRFHAEGLDQDRVQGGHDEQSEQGRDNQTEDHTPGHAFPERAARDCQRQQSANGRGGLPHVLRGISRLTMLAKVLNSPLQDAHKYLSVKCLK